MQSNRTSEEVLPTCLLGIARDLRDIPTPIDQSCEMDRQYVSRLNKGGVMTITAAQAYRCQSRDCACEVRVIRQPLKSNSNPRCSQGSEVKTHKNPVLLTLNSLH